MTGVKGVVLRGRALSQRRRVGVAILFVCRGSVYDVYDTHGSLRELLLCLMLGARGVRASEDATPTLHGCKYICMTYGHERDMCMTYRQKDGACWWYVYEDDVDTLLSCCQISYNNTANK